MASADIGAKFPPGLSVDSFGQPIPRILLSDREDAGDEGSAVTFEHERLMMFARNETSLALATPLMALVIMIGMLNWTPAQPLMIWVCAVLVATGINVALCRQFLLTPISEIEVPVWRRKLGAAEFFHGVCWASLAFVEINSDELTPLLFIMAALLVVIAVRMMLSSSVMQLMFPGTIPLSAALVLRFILTGDMFFWGMALFCAAVHVYLFFIAKEMHATVLNMLAYRAEKDLVVADLEQSRAVSEDARRRAEAASLAKSRFLATMSHEFRTPLNAILGFSEVMKDEVLGPHATPTYKNYSADIHDSGQHLLKLINEILDLSRIEAGRYQLSESLVRLGDVLEDCQRLMSLRAQEKELRLSNNFASLDLEVWADERAVRQICLNLLSNAIKFTPRGGSVQLEIGATSEAEPFMRISDTGPGIPESEIPIVLRSFGQGSFARLSAEGGSGLGLPIVKGLVELHGGRFELDSRLSEGTRVTVVFPATRMIVSSAEPEHRTQGLYTSQPSVVH